MANSETLTIRLSHQTKERLTRLASATRRTKSFLAAEAVTAYVDREAELLDGIKQGLTDMMEGRVVPHDEAMARLRKTNERAERGGD